MARFWSNPGPLKLQPGIVRKCARKRKVSGKQVLEIGILSLIVMAAFVVWFMVGVATGWVV